MGRSASALFVLLAGLLICGTTAPAAAQNRDTWITARTPNFSIVSNASERDTRRLALKLEQFVNVLSTLFQARPATDIPLTVMAFKDDRSFRPFKPLYEGRPRNIAGWFQRTQDENLIALNLNASTSERPFSVVFHEYTHLLTSNTRRPWPVWLMEGIAELYSSFDVQGDVAMVGAPIEDHVLRLRQAPLIPISTLFSVDQRSSTYNEGERQGIFYAQSWALVHYLMLGDNAARLPAFQQFIRAIESGAAPDQAFRDTLKMDFATVQGRLVGYVAGDTYSMVRVRVDANATAAVETRVLTPAESASYLGNFLMRTGRLREAEDYFNRAVTLDGSTAKPYEGLGFLALQQQQFDRAIEHLKLAVARDSRNHLAHYYYADALRREATRDGRAIAPETARTILTQARGALAIDAGFAPAYHLLGYVHLTTGEELTEGAKSLAAGVARLPQDAHLALMLGAVEAQLGRYVEALGRLQRVLADEAAPEVTRNDARRLVSQIETATRGRGPERVAAAPVDLDGLPRLSGVLAAIECTPGRPTLVLTVNGAPRRFALPDPTRVRFFAVPGAPAVNIRCGAVDAGATVFYRSMASDDTVEGEVAAVRIESGN